MSTANHPVSPSPLHEGQRLDRLAFRTLYEAMPPGIKAELIGGVVHMPSPVGPAHGEASADVVTWLNLYRRRTDGVEVSDNTSTALDQASEPQPDASLRIAPEFGGRTRTVRRAIIGAPELVVEVADTTRSTDLGDKMVDYERAGTLEYVVFALNPREILWHVRENDRFVRLQPEPDRLYRSRAFPGLWLDPLGLILGDLDRLIAALDLGLASPDHASFVNRQINAFQENVRLGRVVGMCKCGHPESDHLSLTIDELDPDRAGIDVGGHGGACSGCACEGFIWIKWTFHE